MELLLLRFLGERGEIVFTFIFSFFFYLKSTLRDSQLGDMSRPSVDRALFNKCNQIVERDSNGKTSIGAAAAAAFSLLSRLLFVARSSLTKPLENH
jgi:hypothetical protein